MADITAHDVTEWDSLLHVKLILSVEREFGVRFTLSEINSFQTVGNLMEVLQKKLSNKSSAT
ncbi:MAG: acyl carrier protein [Bdellovibrionota bacterium]